MNCPDYREWFSAYADGALDWGKQQALEEHLKGCAACRQEASALRQMLQELQMLAKPQVPDLLPAIHARLQAAPWWKALQAPWPVSLPWHGLALAATALLVILIARPTEKPVALSSVDEPEIASAQNDLLASIAEDVESIEPQSEAGVELVSGSGGYSQPKFNLIGFNQSAPRAGTGTFFNVERFAADKPAVEPVNSIEATVKQVIDGDTVILTDGRHVRYLGIDTPETRRKDGDGWVKDPEAYAEAATQRNREWVEGKRVRLEWDLQTHDRYGRLLAYVYVSEVMVNAELLKEGFAQPLTIPPNVKHASLFKQLSREARLAKRGLWKDNR